MPRFAPGEHIHIVEDCLVTPASMTELIKRIARWCHKFKGEYWEFPDHIIKRWVDEIRNNHDLDWTVAFRDTSGYALFVRISRTTPQTTESNIETDKGIITSAKYVITRMSNLANQLDLQSTTPNYPPRLKKTLEINSRSVGAMVAQIENALEEINNGFNRWG